ncbi:unnamed protein product [Alternaria alternata]
MPPQPQSILRRAVLPSLPQALVRKKSKPDMSGYRSDAYSISSLGDGILGAYTWTSAPSIRTLVDKPETKGQPAGYDRNHRTLAALLPSQHDADIIFESSNGWMILEGIYRASKEIYVHKDLQSYALDMQAVAQERTIISWLVVRRGLSLAHLMGFQRIIAQEDLNPAIPAVTNAKSIWRSFVDLDRYLGLHLRLPFGADDYPLAADADAHLIHRSKLNYMTRQVAELDRDVSPQAYSAALALDEQLESCMKEMPKDFWEVPNIPSTARSPESFATLERLMVQVWHFEMKIFIHLPYLLRAHLDNRYDYSKVTALQACRNVLMRWFALRNSNITQACCRFAEIGVFIAAVTLTLDIVIELGTKEKSEVKKTKGTDFAMICRLIGEMEKLASASPRERIAARSAVVLKKILSSLDPSKQPVGKVRHTIPFFGTVELEFMKLPIRPVFDIDSDAGKLLNAPATGQHLPVFSFIDNSLWPPADDESDQWDIVLFDGLEDRDTQGNWVF